MNLSNGWTAWILAVIAAAAIMLGLEWVFRTRDRVTVAPIAQAVAFFVAGLVAWPYTHRQNVRLTFRRYVLIIAVPVAVIAAVRIAFRTG